MACLTGLCGSEAHPHHVFDVLLVYSLLLISLCRSTCKCSSGKCGLRVTHLVYAALLLSLCQATSMRSAGCSAECN